MRQRGLDPVRVLYSHSLLHDVAWEHRVQGDRAWTNVTLPCGTRINTLQLAGVLNRVASLPFASLAPVHPSDRLYVAHELQALFLSWLHGLAVPVLNRPTSFGLSGRLRHVSEWIWLATKAGLPNRGYRQTSREQPREWGAHVRTADAGTQLITLLVAGDCVIGPPVPTEIRAGCLRLSRLCGTALLGVEFAVGSDQRWAFAGVSTKPDLRLGGDPLLDALAATMNASAMEAVS